MKLTVDSVLCQGYGLCADEVPELVELDDAGYATILADGEVTDEVQTYADKAVLMCPAKALRLA
jgi:ferredoxin